MLWRKMFAENSFLCIAQGSIVIFLMRGVQFVNTDVEFLQNCIHWKLLLLLLVDFWVNYLFKKYR